MKSVEAEPERNARKGKCNDEDAEAYQDCTERPS